MTSCKELETSFQSQMTPKYSFHRDKDENNKYERCVDKIDIKNNLKYTFWISLT